MATARTPFVAPHSFKGWIDDNRSFLVPPVGNKMMYGAGQHKVMIIGGPNERKDYHIEEGEELFWQIEGDMVLEVMEKGVPKSVVIKEGEMFLLPARIPHSPQRKAGTVGLVIERERKRSESDVLQWYVEGSTDTLYREVFYCDDLGTQLPPVIGRWKASEQCRTGRPTAEPLPEIPFELDTTITLEPAFDFDAWVAANAADKNATLFGGDNEYKVDVVTQAGSDAEFKTNPGETWFHCLRGDGVKLVVKAEDGTETPVDIAGGQVFLLPKGYSFKGEWGAGVSLVVTNSVVA